MLPGNPTNLGSMSDASGMPSPSANACHQGCEVQLNAQCVVHKQGWFYRAVSLNMFVQESHKACWHCGLHAMNELQQVEIY